MRIGLERAQTFARFDVAAHLPHLRGGSRGYKEFVACLPARVYFSHVYKAAGTTINHLINEGCASRNDVVCYRGHPGGACGAQFLPRPPPYVGQTFDTAREPPRSVAARHPPSRAFIFSMVRDPVSRTISALHELKRRGLWSRPLHAGCLGEVLASLRQRGFWDAHLEPQVHFLLEPKGVFGFFTPIRKLPLDFIGTMESVDTVMAYVSARLDASRASQQQQGELPTPEQWLRSPQLSNASSDPHKPAAEEPSFRVTAAQTVQIVATRAQIREICDLYRVDYLALGFSVPDACDGMFSM